MRRKSLVITRLDTLQNLLELTVRGLNNKTLTAEQTAKNLGNSIAMTEAILGFINIEEEDARKPNT